MTDRQLDDLVGLFAKDPTERAVIVVPSPEAQQRVFTQILDRFRAESLEVLDLCASDWLFYIGGAGREPSVRVVVPEMRVPSGRMDLVVLDEVDNKPRAPWFHRIVTGRMSLRGRVLP